MVNLKINDDSIRDIRLVIFDRDGTLIDLYVYWSWMVNKRSELICGKLRLGKKHEQKLAFAMGIDAANKRIRPEGPVGLKKREIVMQAAVDYLASEGLNDTFSVCEEAFKETNALSLFNLKAIIKPIDGMNTLLNQLTKNSCKIAIATTDKAERARITMDFLGITDKLDFIIGENDVKEPKPAPDMALRILEELKVDKKNAVVIGDAVTDIRMGLNAGLKASIAVLTGLSEESELRQITDYVVPSIAAIGVEKAK